MFVGAHVRRHDVHLRANEGDHFLRVAARQAFEFAFAEVRRIAGDAAFGAAIRQAREGAFPTHPHGKSGDFTEGDVGMIAKAAFSCAEG